MVSCVSECIPGTEPCQPLERLLPCTTWSPGEILVFCLQAQRRNRFWEFIEERENGDPFETDEDEVVTFELGEMLLMLLAAGGDDELTDSEDEWDLFHDELEDYYDLDL